MKYSNFILNGKLRGAPLGVRASSPNDILDGVLAAGVGGIGSAIGGLIGASATRKENQRNRDFEAQQAVLANNRNVENATTAYNRQVALIDKQNAYNDPTAERARVEAAGYNPFLYGGNGGNSTSSVAVDQAPGSSAPSASSVGDPGQQISRGIGDAGNSFASIYSNMQMAKKQQNEAKLADVNSQAMLQRLLTKMPNGYSANLQDAYKDSQQASLAEKQANLTAWQTVQQQIQTDFDNAQAYDDSGQAITDADGNPVTNYAYTMMGNQKTIYTNLGKMNAEISNLVAQGKNIDIDTLIKKYDLSYLQPAQLRSIQANIANLNSQVEVNHAAAQNQQAQATSTLGMLPFQKGLARTQANENNERFKGYQLDNQFKNDSYEMRLENEYNSGGSSPMKMANRVIQGAWNIFGKAPYKNPSYRPGYSR